MNQGAAILKFRVFGKPSVVSLCRLLMRKAIARVSGTIHSVRDNFTAMAVWRESWLGRDVLFPIVKAAPARVAFAHIGHLPVHRAQVLRHRHVHFFRGAGIHIVAVNLWIGGFPMPFIVSIDKLERPVRLPQGEELSDCGTGFRRVADKEWFSLP